MLRDDLFLLAHDDDGRLIVSEPMIGAGLAGAMLVDLLLGGQVAVVDGRLDVVDPTQTGDPEADATVGAIAANTDPTGPRAWVSWISDGIYERTGTALAAAGVVVRTTVRRLGLLPVLRYQPANSDDLVRLRARLRFGVHSAEPPDPQTAALAGLVAALRLHQSLLLSMPPEQLLAELDLLAGGNSTTVRQVIRAVDGVITAAAYR
ncbi:MAG TPA: GPP34 family phosphoprotein [Micromonosporaceae bacterium]|jgi:hypothetical protein